MCRAIGAGGPIDTGPCLPPPGRAQPGPAAETVSRRSPDLADRVVSAQAADGLRGAAWSARSQPNSTRRPMARRPTLGGMPRIEMDVDDELLGQAAHALGTHDAVETVRAALAAAAHGVRPPPPRHRPEPGREDPFGPADPTLRPPPAPHRPPPAPHRPPPDFPRPPEVH